MNYKTYTDILGYIEHIIYQTKWDNHVFAVGGCVRDYILKKGVIKDIDIVIDLPNGGIEFAEWLKDKGYTDGSVVTYPNYGTAMFRLKGYEEEIESVQTRKECYHDMTTRNPETAFGTIVEDCHRRDFSINAVYYNISNREMLFLNEYSKDDLKNGIIRTCGDPDIIFNEDPLRCLRAIRFALRYGFTIEDNTYDGICKYASRLSIISMERINDELSKILSANMENGISLLIDTGLMNIILPEFHFDKMISRFNVFDRCKEYDNLYIRLAGLLFDIDNAEEVLRRLKYSNDEIKDVTFYINFTKKYKGCVLDITGNLKKDMIANMQYDCKDFSKFSCAVNARKFIKSIYSWKFNDFDDEGVINICTSKMMLCDKSYFEYKLPVDGNDVMNALNIEPGKKVKEALDMLLQEAFKNHDLTKEDCIQLIQDDLSLYF